MPTVSPRSSPGVRLRRSPSWLRLYLSISQDCPKSYNPVTLTLQCDVCTANRGCHSHHCQWHTLCITLSSRGSSQRRSRGGALSTLRATQLY